jgi:hypothetical protein
MTLGAFIVPIEGVDARSSLTRPEKPRAISELVNAVVLTTMPGLGGM